MYSERKWKVSEKKVCLFHRQVSLSFHMHKRFLQSSYLHPFLGTYNLIWKVFMASNLKLTDVEFLLYDSCSVCKKHSCRKFQSSLWKTLLVHICLLTLNSWWDIRTMIIIKQIPPLNLLSVWLSQVWSVGEVNTI